MDSIKQYFDTVETGYRKMKLITVAACAAAAVAVAASVFLSLRFVSERTSSVYVVDKGSTVMATMARDDVQRDLELQDHLTRFHELMFDLSPNPDAIRRRLETAMSMGDATVRDYYQKQQEADFYNKLIANNVSQQVVVDSIRFDMRTYPYPALVYGTLYQVRQSSMSMQPFLSECQLRDVARSASNPHGLLIERFRIRVEQATTRTRR